MTRPPERRPPVRRVLESTRQVRIGDRRSAPRYPGGGGVRMRPFVVTPHFIRRVESGAVPTGRVKRVLRSVLTRVCICTHIGPTAQVWSLEFGHLPSVPRSYPWFGGRNVAVPEGRLSSRPTW